MSSTIRFNFPDESGFRYMSFKTLSKAEKAVELLKQINVIAEVNVTGGK